MVERGIEFFKKIKPKCSGRTYEDVMFDIMSKMRVGDSISKKLIVKHFWLNGAEEIKQSNIFLVRSLDVYKCAAKKRLDPSIKIRSIRGSLIRSE